MGHWQAIELILTEMGETVSNNKQQNNATYQPCTRTILWCGTVWDLIIILHKMADYVFKFLFIQFVKWLYHNFI